MLYPSCNSDVLTRHGLTQVRGQRFRCGDRGRRFTRRSGSAFSRRAFADESIALAVVAPGVKHRTGRYRTNGLERDHGFLKERLRPMHGLDSISSAAIFTRGHALMRNIRRGFYRAERSRLPCAMRQCRACTPVE
jgi:transposase-like protein